jgi:hypothetical protein
MLTEQQIQFVEKIASLKDFDETFELVKAVVLQKFKLHRAGLSLPYARLKCNSGQYLPLDYIEKDSQIN